MLKHVRGMHLLLCAMQCIWQLALGLGVAGTILPLDDFTVPADVQQHSFRGDDMIDWWATPVHVIVL